MEWELRRNAALTNDELNALFEAAWGDHVPRDLLAIPAGASGRIPTMEIRRILRSAQVRIGVALLYVLLLLWLIPRTPARPPLLLIALGLPLIFRLVPRNYLYGMRTLRTLRGSEETWYRQNIITGVALVAGGVVWLGVLVLGR